MIDIGAKGGKRLFRLSVIKSILSNGKAMERSRNRQVKAECGNA